jgi:hypothetical protein
VSYAFVCDVFAGHALFLHYAKNSSYEKEKLAVSGNYIIGQAYNKGGLVVLSKSEAADPATGKRRG